MLLPGCNLGYHWPVGGRLWYVLHDQGDAARIKAVVDEAVVGTCKLEILRGVLLTQVP